MDAALNLSKLAKYFSNEDDARALLERMRWGGNPACPRCGGAEPYKITPKAGSSTRKGLYKCKACRKPFTVTVGTILEDSHIPISKWLLAMHLMCASKKGMSAHQLHRMLGVTYKTAWFMAHRLRYAMMARDEASKLKGIVEVDETYVGSKRSCRKKRGVKCLGEILEAEKDLMAKREPLLPHLPMKLEDAVEAFLRVKPQPKTERPVRRAPAKKHLHKAAP